MDTSKIDQMIIYEIGLDPNSSTLKWASIYIEVKRLQELLYKAYLNGKHHTHES